MPTLSCLPARSDVGVVGWGIRDHTTRTRDGNGPRYRRLFDPLWDGYGIISLSAGILMGKNSSPMGIVGTRTFHMYRPRYSLGTCYTYIQLRWAQQINIGPSPLIPYKRSPNPNSALCTRPRYSLGTCYACIQAQMSLINKYWPKPSFYIKGVLTLIHTEPPLPLPHLMNRRPSPTHKVVSLGTAPSPLA